MKPLTLRTAPTHPYRTLPAHTPPPFPPFFPPFFPLSAQPSPTHAAPLEPCIPTSLTLCRPVRPVLLSLIITLIPPLQYALEHNSTLRPVNEAVGMCGNCVVPVTLVVYFWGGEERRREARRREGGGKGTEDGQGGSEKPGEPRMVLLAILVHMLLTPPIVPATKSDWYAMFETLLPAVSATDPSKSVLDSFRISTGQIILNVLPPRLG
ncbi:hypothetical protein CVT25_015143 [Psilocybe cyanescens]|uniref:Uncharacterized protein n=1 Tax=Psilocybe cyanescens TaxID=93625 RepID=A0A409WUE5_PSICY|nr:hypothetical protein CVT25_015143 [Psilocybe cyanescens]